MNFASSGLDSVLVEIGEYGKYQAFISILITFVTILNYYSVVVYIFASTPVNHRCKIDGCDIEPTEYNPAWLADAVPFKNGRPERCQKFKRFDNSSCDAISFNNTLQETCDSFIYETTQRSIMHDFNLHCDDNLKALTLVGTISGIAKFTGLPIAGYISDRYGRKKVLISFMLLSGLFGLLRSFTTSYLTFIACEYFDSFFSIGAYTSAYVLGSEFVGPSKRALVSTLQFMSYSFGSITLGCIAWYVQHWRTLLRVLYTSYLLVITYCWLLPESARWLLAKNRQEEAIEIIRKIAKVNGKTITEGKLETLINSKKASDTVVVPITQLFKSKTLTVRFLICCFCWFTCILVYYGLTIISTTLSGNRYLDFILTAAVETPANLISLFMLNKKGRRFTLLLAFALCTISSISYILLPTDVHWIKLSMYLVSKMGITMASSALYIISNEMFPTSLRQTMLSLSSMCGRTGNIIAPQLLLLVEVWKHLPLVVFGTLTGIAGVLAIGLPDTKDVTLPDTIEEAENIGKKR